MVCKPEGLGVYYDIEHHYPGNAEGSVPKKYLVGAGVVVCLNWVWWIFRCKVMGKKILNDKFDIFEHSNLI